MTVFGPFWFRNDQKFPFFPVLLRKKTFGGLPSGQIVLIDLPRMKIDQVCDAKAVNFCSKA